MTNKLTDEQIAGLAPDWATHYSEKLTGIIYQSSKYWQGYTESGYGDKLHHTGVSRYAKPIQRKKFDISEYEFSDDKLSLLIDDADLISINDNCSGSCFDLYKDDVIALAKHFKLTAEDLK